MTGIFWGREEEPRSHLFADLCKTQDRPSEARKTQEDAGEGQGQPAGDTRTEPGKQASS